MTRNFPFILPGIALLALLFCAAPAQAQVILTPGGTAPGTAIGFGAKDAPWQAVTTATPLPVSAMPSQAAAVSTPLAGSATTTQTVGPFTAQLGRPINLRLSGTWTGSAQLMRSIDSGTTKTALTVGGIAWATYTANVNEPVWSETEAGATYYLALTVTSGTITYRVAQ